MRNLLAYLRVPMLRRGVLAALFFGLCFGAVEFGVRQQMERSLQDQTARLDALRTEASVLRARIDAGANFSLRNAQLDAADARFGADMDRSAVVERLTNLSAEAGTRILHGTNTFGRPRGDIVPVEQYLSIEGPYLAVTRFLTSLKTIETLTLLRSAELSANNDGSLVRLKLELVTLSAGKS